MIEFRATSRGALVGVFRDRFGAECSIQESSHADENCVWLGVESDYTGESLINGRMHLTREAAKELAQTLLFFVNEGILGRYESDDFDVGDWVKGILADNHGTKGRIVSIQPGKSITVQDIRQSGHSGKIVVSWSKFAEAWTPDEPPQEGISVYDHLID